MKLPKTFVPEKSSDYKIEELMNSPNDSSKPLYNEDFDENLVLEIRNYLRMTPWKGGRFNKILCVIYSFPTNRFTHLEALVTRMVEYDKGRVTLLNNYKMLRLNDVSKGVEEAQPDGSRKTIIYTITNALEEFKNYYSYHTLLMDRMMILKA